MRVCVKMCEGVYEDSMWMLTHLSQSHSQTPRGSNEIQSMTYHWWPVAACAPEEPESS